MQLFCSISCIPPNILSCCSVENRESILYGTATFPGSSGIGKCHIVANFGANPRVWKLDEPFSILTWAGVNNMSPRLGVDNYIIRHKSFNIKSHPKFAIEEKWNWILPILINSFIVAAPGRGFSFLSRIKSFLFKIRPGLDDSMWEYKY